MFEHAEILPRDLYETLVADIRTQTGDFHPDRLGWATSADGKKCLIYKLEDDMVLPYFLKEVSEREEPLQDLVP